MFNDGTQTARTCFAVKRFFGDGFQCRRSYFKLYAFHGEQFAVLLDQRVFRFGQNLYQRVFGQFAERGHHRQAADQLGDQAELDQIFRLDLAEHFGQAAFLFSLDHGAETNTGAFSAVFNDFFQTGKRTAANEQNIGGVNLQKVLIRVLAPALGRHTGHRAFNQLKQSLLHALARHIAGDRRVVGLAGNFVDFVDVDNAALGALYIVIAVLQQLLNDVFHILADITCLGQRGGVGHDKRHIQHARQCLRQQSLAGAGRADQQNIAFRQLYVVFFRFELVLQTLVVVVHRHRQ